MKRKEKYGKRALSLIIRRQIKPILFVSAIAIVLLGAWIQVYAKQDYVEVNWESLDLSSQQRDTLNDLDDQWKSVVSDVAPRIQTNERKLKQMMRSPSADENQILGIQQEIHEDKTRLKIEATQIFLHKRKILNKHQQEKLQEMIKQY